MRISYWSANGCSSDLQHHQRIGIDIAGLEPPGRDAAASHHGGHAVGAEAVDRADVALLPEEPADRERRKHEQHVVKHVEIPFEVGRASCRERGGQDVKNRGGRGSLKKKTKKNK